MRRLALKTMLNNRDFRKGDRTEEEDITKETIRTSPRNERHEF